MGGRQSKGANMSADCVSLGQPISIFDWEEEKKFNPSKTPL